MLVSVPEFLKTVTEAGDFWIVELSHPDHRYLMERLIQTQFPPEEVEPNEETSYEEGDGDSVGDLGHIMQKDKEEIIYWLRKSRVEPGLMERTFGLDPAVMAKYTGLIRLLPLPAPPKEPTVPYFGEA